MKTNSRRIIMCSLFSVIFLLLSQDKIENPIAVEVSTKNYWIKFNDLIHEFNKKTNSKQSIATNEIKYTIAEIRKIPTKNVDMKVLKYSEKRIGFAVDYSAFLDSIDIADDIQYYKTEFPIKKKRETFQEMQKRYEILFDKNKTLDEEQKELLAYLQEKYKILDK